MQDFGTKKATDYAAGPAEGEIDMSGYLRWGGAEPAAAPPRTLYRRVKPGLEQAAALALLTATLPVILLTAALVRLTSRGPAFYSQRRVGIDGRTFTIYKLRTMTADAESGSGPRWSQPGDPRITPLGRILRVLHLDELPQLVNVLRGEMNLIGPRPERPEIIRQLRRKVPGYDRRHAARPGITGLAQVQLASDTGIDSVRRKLLLDLIYIDRTNAWLDLRIALATGLKMFGVPYRAMGWLFFGVESSRHLEAPRPTEGARAA